MKGLGACASFELASLDVAFDLMNRSMSLRPEVRFAPLKSVKRPGRCCCGVDFSSFMSDMLRRLPRLPDARLAPLISEKSLPATDATSLPSSPAVEDVAYCTDDSSVAHAAARPFIAAAVISVSCTAKGLALRLASRTDDDWLPPTVDCSDANVVDSSSSPIGSSVSGRTPRRRILRGVARGVARGEARGEAQGEARVEAPVEAPVEVRGGVRGGVLGDEERGA